jgi:UDP-N-acetylmuramate dehydrogenase
MIAWMISSNTVALTETRSSEQFPNMKIGDIDMPISITVSTGDKFTCYRTLHTVLRYCEVHTDGDVSEAFRVADSNNWNTYVLGGGSNTFFDSKTINTFVIKNAIKREIVKLPGGVLEISSSVYIAELLRYLYENNRDGPYYLAALPATMGGVIAMNAGRGRQYNKAISDYILSVRFYHEGRIHEWSPTEYDAGYRHTAFLEMKNSFILSSRMKFDECFNDNNPIEERKSWSREHQDCSGPNCGSVFCRYDPKILKVYSRIVCCFPAKFSRRTGNWIVNRSKNPMYLRILLDLCIFVHRILGRKAKLELRRVS